MELEDQINLAGIAALEEAEIEANGGAQRRVFPYNDPFEVLTEIEFRKVYRLTKDIVRNLINELEPFIVAPSRPTDLTISRKILIALRFFASGSYQLDIGNNINNAVSQASVSRCIEEVSNALNGEEIFESYVRFLRNFEDLRRLRNEFFEKFNFPGVIGCIDGTHVVIHPPGISDNVHPEHLYVNRKGYHSINVQLICDSSLKILNVCARFPGSTHDSHIWNNSRVSNFMRNLHEGGHTTFSLLGDSGYPLRTWLLTPVNNPEPGTPEFNYNIGHRQTRSIIERCNGVLKMRFRCLFKHRVLHYKPNKASKIINACVVLHNICVENNLPEPELEDGEDFDYGIYENIEEVNNGQGGQRNQQYRDGMNKRNNLIRMHFQ